MPHDHHGHHHHHHIDPDAGDARVAWAIGVNMLLTVAQIVGGLFAGSIALIADAIHNLSDAMSLVIAFVARKIARRPSDADMTFGYARAEIVAALINYTTLILIAIYLAYEAVWRLFDPTEVKGWIVVVVAGIALAVDTVTALLTYRMSKDSMNIRAAFLHNVADALASVAVIIGGVLLLLYDWRLVDPIITIGISGYILWHSLVEIGPVIRILMLGTPSSVDVAELIDAVEALPGVDDVHHLHIWQIDEKHASLEAHIVSDADAGEVIPLVRGLLSDRFGISHATLQVERSVTACEEPSVIGHA
ncbi:cation diffusion facilitator family transporter [Qingshengfaniella alkalisoli]|uniref:Cation transporter n=1 Tax=Qingshengfaniella alkalisoli TaxID=2599296 RepID=A0A5B8IVS3_9RHOB|nr:cation diffusion facilitator family transporter [Qingshengfaniella alkalisoli]QDY69724.1 cation transporter [Qingshengfaniella alkalisoli]